MSIAMEWDDVPLVLTLEQVADLLQTGRTATYEAYRAGQIPGFRVGRKLRFARESVRLVVEGAVRPVESSLQTNRHATGLGAQTRVGVRP